MLNGTPLVKMGWEQNIETIFTRTTLRTNRCAGNQNQPRKHQSTEGVVVGRNDQVGLETRNQVEESVQYYVTEIKLKHLLNY